MVAIYGMDIHSLGLFKSLQRIDNVYLREWIFTKDVSPTHFVILNQIMCPKIKRYTKMRTRFGFALQKNKGVFRGFKSIVVYIYMREVP